MSGKVKLLNELINYIFFGVLTTIVNIFTFVLLEKAGLHYIVNNFIAWGISVLFAFHTNKKFVFKSSSNNTELIIKEISTFYGSRIFSLIIDMSLMFLLINMLSVDTLISKLIVNVVVIIINYVLSKIFVFKTQNE